MHKQCHQQKSSVNNNTPEREREGEREFILLANLPCRKLSFNQLGDTIQALQASFDAQLKRIVLVKVKLDASK